ncbi:hypothetical protein BGX34_009034 [Mortierella sp. NVP85]|nr:hypothetical protein BGX34_009034 [Mortierella sp. NVP85]
MKKTAGGQMCFRISEQEIEDAVSGTKTAFSNSITVADGAAHLEQCVEALEVAVEILTKVKKDGKRTLNKAKNLSLKKEFEDTYTELRQLQEYSGPDKIQKCLDVAGKWRNGFYTQDSIQIQPPVHENRRSIDSASISSGGSHNIPNQFYQAFIGSRSSGIDTHDEENSDANTPGFSKVDLSVPVIEELDDDPCDRRLSHPAKPRKQYQKHTGRFADVAPRAAPSNIEREYLDPRKPQTKKLDKDESETISSSTRITAERTSTGGIRYVIVGDFSGNAIRVITRSTPSGVLQMTPTNQENGELRRVTAERTESGAIRYVVGDIVGQRAITTRVILGPRIVSEPTSTGEIRYVIAEQYNGNAIRTKFERDEMTGEYRHIPVREPEGEFRFVNEERTETGEVRKVIGGVITRNLTRAT